MEWFTQIMTIGPVGIWLNSNRPCLLQNGWLWAFPNLSLTQPKRSLRWLPREGKASRTPSITLPLPCVAVWRTTSTLVYCLSLSEVRVKRLSITPWSVAQFIYITNYNADTRRRNAFLKRKPSFL